MIDNKKNNRNHHRHSQSALPDNRSQWCTNKEENEAGKVEREFPVPFYLMLCKSLFSQVKIISGIGCNILGIAGSTQSRIHNNRLSILFKVLYKIFFGERKQTLL